MSGTGGCQLEAPLSRRPGLGSDSYTQTRLQHASPQHIHATSRRCFIGPIPEAWLSRHRKSWYRYRPHLSTYSSKTATFDASANISFTRQLSGLDSQSQLSGSYTGPSFPQPDDVSDDMPISVVAPHSPDLERLQDTNSAILGSKAKPGLVKRVSFGDSRKADSARRPSGLSLPRRPAMPPRGASGHNSSYATAVENPDEQLDRHPPSLAPVPAIASGSDHPTPHDSLLHQQSNGSSNDPTSNSGITAGRTNSNSPLLRHEEIERTPSGVSAQREAEGTAVNIDEANIDEASETLSEEPMRPVNPVATGLVHFNIPSKPDHGSLQLAAQAKPSALTALFHSNTQPGELIRAERMLVRVDWTKSEVPPDFNETESLRIETAQIEKWREFMVVCRRKNDSSAVEGTKFPEEDMGDSFLLQMSKSRVLPLVDKRRTSGRSAHEIVLQHRQTRINMYSSLDKTIVLWSKWSKGTRIYLLRPRSSVSAVEWYTFLNTLLGWKHPQTLPIHVPDLNVTLNIEKPFQILQAIQEQMEEQDAGDDMEAFQDAAKGSIAHDLIDRSVKLLQNSPVSGNMQTWIQKDQRIGLAWKRYDRLEWVHGVNEKKMYGSMAMQQSHDLELRIKTHYPTTAPRAKEKSDPMEEPAAVEGFLIRLTSQKGRHKRFGKGFFKRLYFSTHNQYLCFCQPAKALPPKPVSMILGADGKQTPKASALAGQIPLIYAVNPFPIEDGQITWMKGRSGSSVKKMDQLAMSEAQRRSQTLLQTQGYINLCHVEHIRKISQTVIQAQPAPRDESMSDSDSDVDESAAATRSANAQHVFELILENGLTVRLQAYDSLASQEWIKRLWRLSAYWKYRTAADSKMYKDVRRQNLMALDINEGMESIMGQFAQKWEVSRAIASSELFNMCGVSRCRTITMSGVLYYKPRLRAKFDRCTVILCNGKLLIFQNTLRQSSGREIPHIHHERREVLDLEDTYVYSGVVTEDELLYRNQTFDSNNPGHHALPRIFREDQWTSSDEDFMTCFAIWHRKSRTVFRTQAEENEGQTKSRLRYVSSLGRPGRSVVFKTRSRAERDHWVMNICLETDRIAPQEDLRLT